MNDIQQRLATCFLNVFPALTPQEIRDASAATVGAWDSVAHITLLSAVAEEFGVELESEDFAELVSFALIAAYLEKR